MGLYWCPKEDYIDISIAIPIYNLHIYIYIYMTRKIRCAELYALTSD